MKRIEDKIPDNKSILFSIELNSFQPAPAGIRLCHNYRSFRKPERATYHNLSFIWLMGDLKPDYKTIAEFRRKNKKAVATNKIYLTG
ncbi:MAG: transposase [Planctomycetota bacterium]